MKKLNKITSLVLLAASIMFFGCDDEFTFYRDDTPPTPPRNIQVFTGDNQVDIVWDHNPEDDVAGYNVYYNYSYQGKYYLLESTTSNFYTDYWAENGITYYYAVAAYDFDGNESELSYDVAYATPRPEGYNQAIFDYVNFPSNSAYSFSDYFVVPYNDMDADFFFENFRGTYYLNVWEDTDIQDMGATYDIYDIPEAPLSGWISIQPDENVKYVEAVVGHTYVIWTWDNHFAKVRVSLITPERLVFDWAYQTAVGNPALKRGVVPETRQLNITEVNKNN